MSPEEKVVNPITYCQPAMQESPSRRMPSVPFLLAALLCLPGTVVHAQEARDSDPLADLLGPTEPNAGEDARVEPEDSSPPAPVETIPVPAISSAREEDRAALAPEPRQRGIVIEEIVVTAQRRDEAINEVPIAITAFSGENMSALGVTDTRDLSRIVPGFTAAESGGNTPVYTLRGVGFNDQSFTATPTVGVYVDEVPLPYTIMTKGANLDLQRVEVLKGPQGTLYGRNTTGGAINYIANKPTERFEAGASGGYGSYRTMELEGFVSGPLSDALRGRLAARGIRAGEGWQYSNTRADDTLGEVDKQAFRGVLDWDAAENVAVTASVSGWRDRSDAQAPQAIAIQPQNPNDEGGATLAPQVRNYPLVPMDTDDMRVADWEPNTAWTLNDQYWQLALRADWSFSDSMTLTTILSRGDARSDGTRLPQSGFNFYNAEQELFAKVTTSALESRLGGEWGDGHHWLVGLNGALDSGDEFHRLFTDTTSSVFPDPVTGRSPLTTRIDTAGKVHGKLFGAFFNGDWRPATTLRLTLGGRYSREVRDFTGCTFDDAASEGTGLGPIFSAIALSRGSVTPIAKGECFTLDDRGSNEKFYGEDTQRNVSYRAAVDWAPDDGLLFYASYGRGYKSGGFPVLNASGQNQYQPVKQEQILAGEVGGKLTLWDRVLHTDFALFHYDYKDKQLLTRILDPVFGPVPVLRNAPKSKVQGAELSLQWTPLEGLFLSAAASYIKTEIKEFIGSGFDGEPIDFAGRPFNFAPRTQYTVLADYSLPIFADWFLGFGADYSYVGATNSTLEGNPNYAHADYRLINLRARIEAEDKRWSAMIWGRNVTDEFSTVSVFNIGDAVARYAGQPRTWGISYSYRFD
jgi:iron complex outermembrane receptor protein